MFFQICFFSFTHVKAGCEGGDRRSWLGSCKFRFHPMLPLDCSLISAYLVMVHWQSATIWRSGNSKHKQCASPLWLGRSHARERPFRWPAGSSLTHVIRVPTYSGTYNSCRLISCFSYHLPSSGLIDHILDLGSANPNLFVFQRAFCQFHLRCTSSHGHNTSFTLPVVRIVR